MTFDDDYCKIHFAGGIRNWRCKSIDVTWPPPGILVIEGVEYQCVRRSQITDIQRGSMTNVCRGAEYYPKEEVAA